MFFNFYGLREQPFGVTPDPRFLYESAVHREALASLIYAVESDIGFTALVAAPGMGKTTLLYHLLERYRRSASTAFIFDTQCDSRELLQSLLMEFGSDVNTTDLTALRNRIKDYLLEQARTRRRVLFFIDEAQNLDATVLETVRLLSNFETSSAKLLHIIMAGQPQLEDKLARPELAQLRQRIAMFTHLAPFSAEETATYIAHRLAVAGYRGSGTLFTPNALAIIAAETRGVPREINRICFHALSLGCALHKRTVDAEILCEVCADLGIRPRPELRMTRIDAMPEFNQGNAAKIAVAPQPMPMAKDVAFDLPAAVPMSRAISSEKRLAVEPSTESSVRAPAQSTPTKPAPAPRLFVAPAPAVPTNSAATGVLPPLDFTDPFAPRPLPPLPPQPDPAAPERSSATSADRAAANPAPRSAPADDPVILDAETVAQQISQQISFGLKLASHRKPTRITAGELAAIALGLPVALWLLAFLVFRFNLDLRFFLPW